jgi:hypothetical protein
LIDIGVEGIIVQKLILNGMEGCGVECCGSGCGHVAGFCENGDEISVFIKCGSNC